MAENISDQMKQLSLEPDKILGKSLEAELQCCKSVKDPWEIYLCLGTHTVKSMLHCFLCLQKG